MNVRVARMALWVAGGFIGGMLVAGGRSGAEVEEVQQELFECRQEAARPRSGGGATVATLLQELQAQAEVTDAQADAVRPRKAGEPQPVARMEAEPVVELDTDAVPDEGRDDEVEAIERALFDDDASMTEVMRVVEVRQKMALRAFEDAAELDGDDADALQRAATDFDAALAGHVAVLVQEMEAADATGAPTAEMFTRMGEVMLEVGTFTAVLEDLAPDGIDADLIDPTDFIGPEVGAALFEVRGQLQ